MTEIIELSKELAYNGFSQFKCYWGIPNEGGTPCYFAAAAFEKRAFNLGNTIQEAADFIKSRGLYRGKCVLLKDVKDGQGFMLNPHSVWRYKRAQRYRGTANCIAVDVTYPLTDIGANVFLPDHELVILTT